MTLAQELEQFIGTEHWYRILPKCPLMITDGVKYFADKGEAYWAVTDILLTAQIVKLPFLLAKVICKDCTAKIVYEDGDGRELPDISTQYPTTDLEQGVYKFYIVDDVMLLPSEY